MDKALLNVTMNQMMVFFKVAETNGFSSAAMELFVSQSTVSKIISKLEQELGIMLFERTTRTLKLTEEGMLLYRSWKPQIENMSQVFNKAKHLKEGAYLSVGLADTMLEETYFLPLQKQFENIYHDTVLFYERKRMNELAYRLQEGYYDLIMVPDFERYTLDNMGLPWKWVKKSQAKVVLHKSSRYAGKSMVEMKDILIGEFLNLNSKKPGNYEKDLYERFRKYNVRPRVKNPYTREYVRRSLLENAYEMLFIDDYYIYGNDTDTVKIPVKDEYNGVICAWSRQNNNAATKKLLDIL